MSSYFKYLPQVVYYYGDETNAVSANNLTVYIDIIDQLKKNLEFYSHYYIQEDERPDQLSHRIYKTPDYHWTFFLLNDNLKVGGWPLSTQKIYEYTKKKHNRLVLTVDQSDVYQNVVLNNLNIGDVLVGGYSNLEGTIVNKRLEFGQLTIETTIDPETNLHKSFSENPQTQLLEVLTLKDSNINISAYTQVAEYNSVRYYVDNNTNEEIVPELKYKDMEYYADVAAMDSNLITPITQLEYYINENNDLRKISILKPEVVLQVVNEFKRLANER